MASFHSPLATPTHDSIWLCNKSIYFPDNRDSDCNNMPDHSNQIPDHQLLPSRSIGHHNNNNRHVDKNDKSPSPQPTPPPHSPHRLEQGMYVIGVVNDQLQLRAAFLLHWKREQDWNCVKMRSLKFGR